MSEDGMKQEKIGSVTLNLTYYSGQDYYSDGDIEDEMLDIAMNNPAERFPEIIEEKRAGRFFTTFPRSVPISSTGFRLKRRTRCSRLAPDAERLQERWQKGQAALPASICPKSAVW